VRVQRTEGHDGEAAAPPSRTRARQAWHVLGAGTASFVLAAGFLAGSAADLPWNSFAHHAEFQAPPPEVPEPVEIVGAATTAGPQTVDEVLGAVQSAEQVALESGRELGPEIHQAAAELGSVLLTYVAQREALVDPQVGAVGPAVPAEPAPEDEEAAVPDVPIAVEDLDRNDLDAQTLEPLVPVEPAQAEPADGASGVPSGTQAAPSEGVGAEAPTGAGLEADQDEDAEGSAETETAPEDLPALDGPGLDVPTFDELLAGETAFTVANSVEHDGAAASASGSPVSEAIDGAFDGAAHGNADGVDDGSADGAAADAGHENDTAEGHEHAHDAVTFDDVVVAATHLVTLLDPASAAYVVDVQPAVTLMPDGTYLSDDGVQVTADGIPLDGASTLSAALAAVVAEHGASTAGYLNGRIPTSVLCAVESAPGHLLRCDAAEQFAALNAAYRDRFGVDIPITDSYRSYDAQVAVRIAKPHLAAVPGTSNHGWGLALDLSTPISGGASAEYTWLRVHGPDYGWDNPSWARPGGVKPEPWHFEFFAAGPVPDRASSAADVTTAAGGSSSGGDGVGAGVGSGSGNGGSSDSAEDRKGSSGTSGKGGSGSKDASKDTSKGGGKKPQPSPSPSVSPKPKPAPEPSPSPSGKPTGKPTAKPSPSQSPSPSASPKPTPTSTPTPEPSEPSEPKPTPSGSADPEPTEPTPSESAPPSDGSESGEQDEGTAGDGGTAGRADDTSEKSTVNRQDEDSDGPEADPEDDESGDAADASTETDE